MSSIIGIQYGTRLGRRVDNLLPTSIAAMWHQVRMLALACRDFVPLYIHVQ